MKAFTEEGAYGEIGFLLPTPLEKHIDEFETGRQMTDRHRAWAEEVTGGQAVTPERMSVATSIWSHYDPVLCRDEVETLKLLGFNTINDGRWPEVLKEAGVSPFWQTGFEPDPELQQWHWHTLTTGLEDRFEADPEARWRYDNTRWVTISDEIKVLETVERKIQSDIESVLGIKVDVKLVEPKTLIRSEGKAKRVIDKRQL